MGPVRRLRNRSVYPIFIAIVWRLIGHSTNILNNPSIPRTDSSINSWIPSTTQSPRGNSHQHSIVHERSSGISRTRVLAIVQSTNHGRFVKGVHVINFFTLLGGDWFHSRVEQNVRFGASFGCLSKPHNLKGYIGIIHGWNPELIIEWNYVLKIHPTTQFDEHKVKLVISFFKVGMENLGFNSGVFGTIFQGFLSESTHLDRAAGSLVITMSCG
mmetsp:Transcript_24166/g.59158  ORF Transcript_24166/g.59158 Transcript_24166/m.59158 type:complete len:214 (-) Transcript_24166:207-848(-)